MNASNSKTPLSDLILELERKFTQELYNQFLEEFCQSKVGIIARGAPEGTVGEFIVSGEDNILFSMTVHTDGKLMLLAFADPTVFACTFGAQFNAEISGKYALEAVLRNPDCQGILVNSAKSKSCIVIHLEAVQFLLNAKKLGENADEISKNYEKHQQDDFQDSNIEEDQGPTLFEIIQKIFKFKGRE